MLDMFLVMGVVVGLTEILKKKFNIDKMYMWILVLGIASGLNCLNAFAFGGDIQSALKDGIYNAALASGVYSLGKSALEGGIKSE
jgi:hypothetical protein